MQRKDFIKQVGLGGLLITGFSETEKSQLNIQNIKIYDNYVRGSNHYYGNLEKLNLKADDSTTDQCN